MSRNYTARSPHKRPCDICGVRVEVGDAMTTWCYLGEDGPESSNIIRAHESCAAIVEREEIEAWALGKAFMDDGIHRNTAPVGHPPKFECLREPQPTPLAYEAATALANHRAQVGPTLPGYRHGIDAALRIVQADLDSRPEGEPEALEDRLLAAGITAALETVLRRIREARCRSCKGLGGVNEIHEGRIESSAPCPECVA